MKLNMICNWKCTTNKKKQPTIWNFVVS